MITAATATSSHSSRGGAPITPLDHSKTFTITFTPDWIQAEMQSQNRPLTISVVLGPAGTLPQHSQWCLEFRLFCEETSSAAQSTSSAIAPGGESFAIPKGERALLWHGNAPYPRFEHSIVRSGCRLSSGDELKTISVALRTHADEKHLNALVYVRRNGKIPKSDSNTGYFKVVRRHRYNLNITFACGSTIAQLMAQLKDLNAWRPMIYLSRKTVDLKTGKDSIIGSRVFTDFKTNWSQDVELDPSDGEQKGAAESMAADKKEEEALRVVQKNSREVNSMPVPTKQTIAPLMSLPSNTALDFKIQPNASNTNSPSAAPQPQQHPSDTALTLSMMAQLSISANPSQADLQPHNVLRAQHQHQQAQLLTLLQLQYQNQQRAMEQYNQLKSHQFSLTPTQQQQMQVQTAHKPMHTQHLSVFFAAADPAAISAAVTEANLRGNQTAAAGTSAPSGTSAAAGTSAVTAAAPIASSSATSTSAATVTASVVPAVPVATAAPVVSFPKPKEPQSRSSTVAPRGA